MNLLIVAATPFEIAPCKEWLKESMIPFADNQYQKGAFNCELLVTGVGIPATIFQLSKTLLNKSYQLVINVGIAGSFDPKLPLGSVLQVTEDRFGDLGIEEADASFKDLFDIELEDPNKVPFKGGKLINESGAAFNFLPQATAITVNKVHGFPESIERIKEKYEVHLESMEGAAVFYVCQQLSVPVLQIRSVSNYVEKRNREKWDLGLAIKNLNEVLIESVKSFL